MAAAGWQSSGGYRSVRPAVAEVRQGLEEPKPSACRTVSSSCTSTRSQIPNIRIVKGALNEAARIYAELAKEGVGPKSSTSVAVLA
jgi:arginine decarboxylase-like protein